MPALRMRVQQTSRGGAGHPAPPPPPAGGAGGAVWLQGRGAGLPAVFWVRQKLAATLVSDWAAAHAGKFQLVRDVTFMNGVTAGDCRY